MAEVSASQEGDNFAVWTHQVILGGVLVIKERVAHVGNVSLRWSVVLANHKCLCIVKIEKREKKGRKQTIDSKVKKGKEKKKKAHQCLNYGLSEALRRSLS